MMIKNSGHFYEMAGAHINKETKISLLKSSEIPAHY